MAGAARLEEAGAADALDATLVQLNTSNRCGHKKAHASFT